MPYMTRSYRLETRAEQEETLREWVGCARLVWNLALEQRRIAWSLNKSRTDDRRWIRQPFPGYALQCRELTELRSNYPWLAAVPAQPLQQRLHDLDSAFRRFFDGLSAHPVSKRKGKSSDSFRFPDPAQLRWQRLSKHAGRIKLPKLGWVRFRWSREVCCSKQGEQVKT